MDTIGQEFLLPALHPREIWEASGRWAGMGDNMFRLKDRKGADLCLGMTHEEVMTDIARNELRSYKQLPQIWYQIQTKFRDEPRPKSGLLRVRQFLMKDAYSFDIDDAGLDLSYDKHDRVYRNIFTRCGLEFVAVEADSGAMGGSQSQEFMVYTEAGEDLIASCPACRLRGESREAPPAASPPVEDLAATGDGTPELVHTPGQRTIDEVGAFLDDAAAAPDQDHGLHGRSARGRSRQAGQAARRRRLPARRPPAQRGQARRPRRHLRPAPHDPEEIARPSTRPPATSAPSASPPRRTRRSPAPWSSSTRRSKAAPT